VYVHKDSNSYTFSDLDDGLAYYFAITVYDSNNESGFSEEIVFNSPVAASESGSDLVLTWSAAGGAARYVVYRNTVDPYFTPASSDSIAAVTGVTFTDTGVLGDPETNCFYVVEAVGPSGQTVGVLCRAGGASLSLSPGYNLVGYILDEGLTTGQQLGESIPGCTNVLRSDASTGQWISVAQKVLGTWVNHEEVLPGHAYMAYVETGGVWTQAGRVLPDPHFDLLAGYNMITLPAQYAQTQGIATGADLGGSIPDCANVLRRDAATGKWVIVAERARGRWISHEAVVAGRAYIVYASGSSVWP
jgi:hypothetical protein